MVSQRHFSPFNHFADKFCVLNILFEYISLNFMQFLSSGMDIFNENDT